MEEIEFLVDDEPITLEFLITTNTATLYLPDGSNRLTTLNGLDAYNAIRPHIRSFYKNSEVTFT